MKGMTLNLLAEVVQRQYGSDARDALFAAAGVEGKYEPLADYSPDELIKLVGVASVALNVPPDTIVRWFGRHALPILAAEHPKFFTRHRSTREFLLTLNDIHHEARRLYPGAAVPTFDVGASEDCVFRVICNSPRKLCVLGEGLILGVADFYREEVEIRHPGCLKRGDPNCVWDLTFTADVQRTPELETARRSPDNPHRLTAAPTLR